MAHGFSITRQHDGLEANFYGYANGILYKCFKCEDFDKVVSGSGEERIFKKPFVHQALVEFLASTEIRTYPDPTRADELRHFLLEELKLCVDTDEFTVCFW
jgi:hypothetical protein